MASNTLYWPQTLAELDSSKITGFGQGVGGNCSASTTTTFDLTLSDDVLITGVQLITSGSSSGDYLQLDVLAGASVVSSPIPGPWYVASTAQIDFTLAMPVKIASGLKVRITYTATGLIATPFLAINYKFWKVLY